MDAFIQRHPQDVLGVVSGFDRMRFRGTLRSICYAEGVDRFLARVGVRCKDFKEGALGWSEQLIEQAREVAQEAGRPFAYVASSNEDKQAEAQRIARREGITKGLVCVLRCVESCQSFAIRREGQGGFRFRPEERRCLYRYYYYLDREFGLMHVRLATWLPFGIQVCLNGREYLARRMSKAGIGFEQRDNCFVWIVDLPRAQQMMQDLEERQWERWLQALAVVDVPSPAHVLLEGVSRPVTKDQRPYRALRPGSQPEAAVFAAVLQGEFLLKGFTNRDLREQLEPRQSTDPQERRRASGRTTRRLRLLRAHGLIRKVSGTRYYRVTPKGQQIMTAALRLRDADVAKLAA